MQNNLSTIHHILIIGAFDRYNYGDLLFPLVIEEQLKTYGKPFEAQYFGLVASDLSEVGGKPTQHIDAFYREANRERGSASIIVAGGEALAVTWNSLLLSLSPLFKKTHRFHERINRVFDLNGFARKRLGGQTTLPFTFSKHDFKGVDHVIFNSLGGSEVDPLIFKQLPNLEQTLREVDYFSVRDKVTHIRMVERQIANQLYPDSAILMSRFYPVEWLEKKVSVEVRRYVVQEKGNYIFFQVKENHAKQHEHVLAAQLNEITAKSSRSLCFCPIGKALNHDDHIALQRLAPLLTKQPALFNEVTVWDIMYLIANSRMYMGTSLHGAITAMSFAVPYVGLNVVKLNSYLSTWGVPGLQHVFPFTAIFDGYQRAEQADPESLIRSREQQLALIQQSFDQIASLVLPSSI